MTTLARKHIGARIYAIGGFGIKTVSSFLANTDPRSVQHVDFSFLDTSGSDLSAGLKPEEVYLFRNMDGGGKDPRNTYKQVLPYLDDLLEKHAPADFNIVVHSSSGGSGSSVGRALVSRLLKDGQNVVVLQVGSVASKKEVENTIGTIKSYATFSNMYQRPVVSYYRENNESTPRRLVDDHIRSALYLLTLIFSAENRGLDIADLTNLLDYNKETVVQETDPVDYQVLPTNSLEVKEILDNPNLSEEEKLKAINDLSEKNEAKMKEAYEKRDSEVARKMMMELQAMVAGMGIKSPNMFNGFKFPKPPKVKEPNEVLQSAAEAKRARKAAKNLAIAQKKTLTKA